ncbi:MAG: glycosyltransferase family 2 protein [Lachnospiraceae bacterium]|nr:glycosyltransferase family 2 protein [Lachnospiraceae bacterium]
MLVSIVVPCYNSEFTIEKLVDLCMEEFDKMEDYDCEMVLVNDYSKDRTFEAITRAAKKYKNVIGVNLAKNCGQHAAIMAGLQYVQGDLVVGMDDDLQNHPSQIRQFLDKVDEGYDVVFGVFKERKFSAFKNLTGAISQFLLFHLVDRPKDIQMSSFWLARRYIIEEIKKYQGSDVFVQLLFVRTTRNLANIEIEHYEREVGESNYTFRKGLKLFMSFMNYSTIPLQIATVFGVLFSGAGFIAALVILVRKLMDPTITVGWSSLMCIILIVSGITFLMLGIIGEYVGKLIMTLNKTPLYVVRETLNTENGIMVNSMGGISEKMVAATQEPKE